MIFAIKKSLLFVPLIIIAVAILFVSPWNKHSKKMEVPASIDIVSKEAQCLRDSLSASIDSLKLLKPEVNKAIRELKQYKEMVNQYEMQEADIVVKKVVDSSALTALRARLNYANNEIARLNGELAVVRYKSMTRPKIEDRVLTERPPEVETPDENSIIIKVDGKSRRGDIPTNNLTIYLIPYNKRTKLFMSYDSSCSDIFVETAKYYNGIYFFNNVRQGKYIIKICTYFGNYKLINKQEGKQDITMQVSPPLQ